MLRKVDHMESYYTVVVGFQTFLTLSLSDISRRVHLNSAKEAELHVLSMVSASFIPVGESKVRMGDPSLTS